MSKQVEAERNDHVKTNTITIFKRKISMIS